jgi:hypothetical protein
MIMMHLPSNVAEIGNTKQTRLKQHEKSRTATESPFVVAPPIAQGKLGSKQIVSNQSKKQKLSHEHMYDLQLYLDIFNKLAFFLERVSLPVHLFE